MTHRAEGVDAWATALRARETTAQELARAALAGLDGRGRELNAVVALTEERALAEARRADEELRRGIDRGPLHGIPYGAKDLLQAEGAPTTWGMALHRDRRLLGDAAAISRLARAGAVLVAKLATDELAGGLSGERADASITGPCRNPHDPGRFAGSSSGGPAAAVGAGLLPFALGTETIGSIVEPASFCGVVGVRPTRGRVSRDGCMPLAPSLDVVGILAGSVADGGNALKAIGSSSAMVQRAPSRIGVPSDAHVSVAPSVEAAFREAIDALDDLGLEVLEVELPALPAGEAALTILAAECVANHRDFLTSMEASTLISQEHRGNIPSYLTVSGAAYVRAQQVTARCAIELASLFEAVDAIATPTAATPAPPIDARFDEWIGAYRMSWPRAGGVLAGLPAVTVPYGRDADGLPLGACLTAAPGNDEMLLALAAGLAG